MRLDVKNLSKEFRADEFDLSYTSHLLSDLDSVEVALVEIKSICKLGHVFILRVYRDECIKIQNFDKLSCATSSLVKRLTDKANSLLSINNFLETGSFDDFKFISNFLKSDVIYAEIMHDTINNEDDLILILKSNKSKKIL